MTEASEKNKLLQQIKYLTDLINEAKEKKPLSDHTSMSTTVMHSTYSSFQKCSNSFGGYPLTVKSKLHKSLQPDFVPSKLTLASADKIQRRKHISFPCSQERVIETANKKGNLKGHIPHNLTLSEKRNVNSANSFQTVKSKVQQDDLFCKKAEVSRSRKLMVEKIIVLKASIAQLEASKKSGHKKQGIPPDSGTNLYLPETNDSLTLSDKHTVENSHELHATYSESPSKSVWVGHCTDKHIESANILPQSAPQSFNSFFKPNDLMSSVVQENDLLCSDKADMEQTAYIQQDCPKFYQEPALQFAMTPSTSDHLYMKMPDSSEDGFIKEEIVSEHNCKQIFSIHLEPYLSQKEESNVAEDKHIISIHSAQQLSSDKEYILSATKEKCVSTDHPEQKMPMNAENVLCVIQEKFINSDCPGQQLPRIAENTLSAIQEKCVNSNHPGQQLPRDTENTLSTVQEKCINSDYPGQQLPRDTENTLSTVQEKCVNSDHSGYHLLRDVEHIPYNYNTCDLDNKIQVGKAYSDHSYTEVFSENKTNSIILDEREKIQIIKRHNTFPLNTVSNVLEEKCETSAKMTVLKEKTVKQKCSQKMMVAELKKELKATEEKLQHMRQKFGCLLKKSPSKSCRGFEAGSTNMEVKTSQSSVNSNQTVIPAGSASSPLGNIKLLQEHDTNLDDHSLKHFSTISRPLRTQRSFTNKSLKWTSNSQSCKGALVSSSPSLRSLRRTSSHSLSSPTGHIYQPRSSQDRARVQSPYKVVKNQTRLRESSMKSVLEKCKAYSKIIDRQSSSKGFCKESWKYSSDKCGLSPRVSTASGDQTKSCYKLVRKVNEEKNSLSTVHQSVIQRAAKIIISKYKMQKIPIQYSFTDAPLRRTQSSVNQSCMINKYQYPWKQTSKSSYLKSREGFQNFTYKQWMRQSCRYRFKQADTGSFQQIYNMDQRKRRQFQTYTRLNQFQDSKYSTGRFHYNQMRRRQDFTAKNMLTMSRNNRFAKHQTEKKKSVKLKTRNRKPERLLLISGVLYKSSSTHLTKTSQQTLSGSQSQLAWLNAALMTRRKSPALAVSALRGLAHHSQTKDWALEKIAESQTRSIISRVKQRSRAMVAAKFKKDNTKDKKKHCLFFCRFGRCSRGDRCQYVHDPEKVAVCTRFLRGTCKVEKCPFSHKVAKEKMPVCAFFLRGICIREDCPYSHVKVSPGAEICQDFVNGFCPLADKCNKLHSLMCPTYAQSGSCPRGRKCRLMHKQDKFKRSESTLPQLSSSSSKQTKTTLKSGWLKKEERKVREDDGSHRKFAPIPDFVSKEGEGYVPLSKQTCLPNFVSDKGEDYVPPNKLACLSDFVSREKEDFVSSSKLGCLPAFISLADYSIEESPQLVHIPPMRDKTDQAKTVGCVVTNPCLQIKPRLSSVL